MGEILLFPSPRRRRLIESIARRAAAARDPEPTIAHAVRTLREARRRAGIPDDAVFEDVDGFEMAIRGRLVLYRASRTTGEPA